ncbi:scavenger receptor cysteine-rich type 5, partial [Clarias magur]
DTGRVEPPEDYDDAVTAGPIPDNLEEDEAENYDEAITADQKSVLLTEDVSENYDDAVTAETNTNITTDNPEDYDDVITEEQDGGETEGSSMAFHEGRVRLSGGSECQGEVEIYFRQDWRRVLLDSWSLSEASVLCRQLGCGSVLNYRSSPSTTEHKHMCVTGFSCSGSEAHLGNCSSAQPVNCSSGEQLYINCSEFKELRLTEGCEGNLEVFYNGTWGNVCHNQMDDETVNMVCRELNCGRRGSLSATEARVKSAPNWLDYLKCRKPDSNLWQCPSSPWGQNRCDNSDEVAHITCTDDKKSLHTQEKCSSVPSQKHCS